jgi:hypothetical protein
MASEKKITATTIEGEEITVDPSQLKFSLGQAIDEETFKQRYAAQGVAAPNVISLKDLSRMKLAYKLQQMAAARSSTTK